ncbi:Protein kinase domain-containing protein [Streptomyces zhaozhouensis]|uniref:non-specific serine/threonine protein kinase n=1 Tax=Streptomyces zhaozhouensis TaxID=1300267 RepID=A0A286DTG1_9ACTN|nr:serine/threonine-protein kinase [Streptomyces zhaozhouensis]SOD61949.1 Protein kinase domain-containing protein [Streptomyces zhaozhouensis]
MGQDSGANESRLRRQPDEGEDGGAEAGASSAKGGEAGVAEDSGAGRDAAGAARKRDGDDAEDAAGGAAEAPKGGEGEGRSGGAAGKGGGAGGRSGAADVEDRPTTKVSPGRGAGASKLLNGRYRLGSVVGRGGMGTVWRARDEVLGRSVAVKELRLSAGIEDAERKRMITRTLREAKAIATIRSRGVVTIYDVVDEGSRPWIVMELIEGRSLADIIRQDGPMSPRRAAETGLAILDVLRDAHLAGILHRDVKPSNVIVADDEGRVVLTDFGIAKVEGDPSITSTGMLVGAPSYISPERARGASPGPPADMWSLGALLYCCVEGRPPYDEGSAIATLAAVMHDPVPPPAKAGPLADLIMELLRKKPEDRPAEPRVRELLNAALTGGEGSGSTTDHQTLVVGASTPKPGDVPAVPRGGSGEGARGGGDAKDAGASASAGARPKAGARDPRTPARPATPVGAAGAPEGPRTPPPARRPGDDEADRRRLRLAIGAVALALVVLGTAVVIWLTSGDDGGNDEGGGSSQGREQGETEGQQGGNEPGPEGGSGGDSEGGPEGEDGEGDSAGASGESGGEDGGSGGDDGPPGTSPENDPDAEPDGPSGYAEVVDADFHFRISLPQGWQRIGIAGQNSGAIYAAESGSPVKLQVDFNGSPGSDAEAAWRDLEPAVRGNSDGYEPLGIESVEWRDYPTVADWQFERVENGERVRVLNRGFKVDDDRGYAIMITCPAGEWEGGSCETLRETAFQTFQPLE